MHFVLMVPKSLPKRMYSIRGCARLRGEARGGRGRKNGEWRWTVIPICTALEQTAWVQNVGKT